MRRLVKREEVLIFINNMQRCFFLWRLLSLGRGLKELIVHIEFNYIAFPQARVRRRFFSVDLDSLVAKTFIKQRSGKVVRHTLHKTRQDVYKRQILLCKENAPVPEDVADFVVRLPEFEDIFMPMLMIVPLQLFAYYMSVLRGCDVDKPRNLAKSVTVE